MLYPEMSIKEGVAKEMLIGLASIRYGCSNLLYHGATLTFFSVCVKIVANLRHFSYIVGWEQERPISAGRVRTSHLSSKSTYTRDGMFLCAHPTIYRYNVLCFTRSSNFRQRIFATNSHLRFHLVVVVVGALPIRTAGTLISW